MMPRISFAIAFLLTFSLSIAIAQPNTEPSKVTIDPETHALSINGKKIFTIGFTVPPPPDAKAFNGKPALEEFRDAGAVFIRTGPMLDPSGEWKGSWDARWIATEKAYMDAAAKAGMYCMPWLKELSHLEEDQPQKEEKLRTIIRMFKDHPGMGIWKGEDEPQWAELNSKDNKNLVPGLKRAYDIIHQEDANHPVWIVQAPRGNVQQLRRHNVAYDIGGVDVYPISYPPGSHVPTDANKELSMVGDYTRKMIEVVEDKKPIWFTLQIAWSGVTKPGKQLRFPTFHEERFMTYEAIINGARGLIYFGGNLPVTLNERDKELGWNWTYWQRVLRPLIEEIGDKSPLAQALVAPNSKMPVKAKDKNIELCVREVGKDVYLLACSKDAQKTSEIEFTGLPKELAEGVVLYESPRKIAVKEGAFTDWFAPFEVHVYKFTRP
ncbi:MAG: hypothetical protein QOF78_2435 [Phycisphaerales bacterium]|nr:hypothetical protein [Phycisphaerales bacterium]